MRYWCEGTWYPHEAHSSSHLLTHAMGSEWRPLLPPPAMLLAWTTRRHDHCCARQLSHRLNGFSLQLGCCAASRVATRTLTGRCNHASDCLPLHRLGVDRLGRWEECSKMVAGLELTAHCPFEISYLLTPYLSPARARTRILKAQSLSARSQSILP
jgi:hypothetical protein